MERRRAARNISFCRLGCMAYKPHESADWAWSESGDLEIPSEEWERFLESFSKQHQDWVASVARISNQQASMHVFACRLQRIISEASQIRLSMECGGGDQLDES